MIESAKEFLARGQGRHAAVSHAAAVQARSLDVADLNAVTCGEERKPCKGTYKDGENRLRDSRCKKRVNPYFDGKPRHFDNNARCEYLATKPDYVSLF